MKTLLLLFFCVALSAQHGVLINSNYPLDLKLEKTKPKIITWERFITASLCFGSGAFNGTGEILRNKYHKFKAVHPNANDQWWNPLKSHENKWKDGHISNGEKFFLSSTALVFLTDGYHFMRTFEKNLMVGAITINLFGPKQKWYVYLAEFFVYSAAWSVGFHTTYSLTYGGMRP